MSSWHVLGIQNFFLPFVVECDSFGEGIGVFLTQRGHPIEFDSRKLNQSKNGYSIYDKEMLQSCMHFISLDNIWQVGDAL